jgi:hypothetical protein
MFNEEELHYHLSGALKNLHELMHNEDAEIALEATKALAQLIIEIQFHEAEQQTTELIQQLQNEEPEQSEENEEN